jgi:undecaprenyl-diphosphatase
LKPLFFAHSVFGFFVVMHYDAPMPSPTSSKQQARAAVGLRARKALLIGLAVTLLAFAGIGGATSAAEALSVDLYLLHAAQTLRLAHPWFASAMRDLSGLGSTSVLTVLTVAVTGYLWLIAQARQALLVAAAATSGTLLVSVFKDFFARLRQTRSWPNLRSPA